MKKIVSVIVSLAMVLALAATVSAVKVDNVELELYSTTLDSSVMVVDDNTVSVSNIADGTVGTTLTCNSAMYNADASIHDGFTVEITDIAWDASNNNGVLIYVSPVENGTVASRNPSYDNFQSDGLALYVSKTGYAGIWTNVKYVGGGVNPATGVYPDLYAGKADALTAGATSFYYSVLPLDTSYSRYGVFVTSSAPVVAVDTPIYTYNTTWTTSMYGDTPTTGFGATDNTLFNAAKNDSETFNFSFQIWADGNLGFDGVTTIPTAGSLSYKVTSIDLPSVISGSSDNEGDEAETKDVYATYIPAGESEDVYSVNITWGTFEYEYKEAAKVWNPDTLVYDEEGTTGWEENTDGTIEVENCSNVDIDVTLTFTAKEEYNTVGGEFYVDAVKLEDAQMLTTVDTNPDTSSFTAVFKPTGALTDTVTEKTVVGTITVTIQAASAVD